MKTKFVIMALAMGFASQAFSSGFETFTRRTDLQVRPAETVSLALGHHQYVKNIVVQAEGIRNDSIIEVMVNGDVKGTIYAPGADPSYVVTIESAAQSIEFRHRYGATMRILAVTATVSQAAQVPRPKPRFDQPALTALAIAERVIAIVDSLAPYATLAEESQHLMPIKVRAGQLKIMLESHGFYSTHTGKALDLLEQRLQASDEYLMSLMEGGAMFDTAVEILTIKERIKDLRN